MSWAGARLGRRVELEILPGDGGLRQYFRLPGDGLLLLAGGDPAENLAWLRIGRHLWFKGLALPRIYDYDPGRGFFLLEDLGDERLADPPDHSADYFQAVEVLAGLHRRGLADFNPAWCFQTRAYNAAMAEKQEIGYFLNSLLGRYLGWRKRPRGLAAEIKAFSRQAAAGTRDRVLMHRDYQGRNLMLNKGRVCFIDWQGARPGPAAYDLSSLLEETPYLPLAPKLKEELVEAYLKARGPGAWRRNFRKELRVTGAARMMQALGAYAKLTLAGKNKFAAYIPPLLARLRERFEERPLRPFPALKAVIVEAEDLLKEK
ncbi:MAG: phosphotransferase [Candidatus Adiutrix sp.]|nr:phosphotransferase [Candidatus Adiutrix sp.]